MSGTGGVLGCGCPQAPAVPAEIAFVRFPSWPLQFIDVFDRSEQPARFTTGAPLSTSDWCDAGCPLSRVKIQELSGSLAVAVAETPTLMESIFTIPSMAVGTLAL